MTRTTVLFVQGGAQRAGAERILLALLRHLDPARVRPVVAFLERGPFEAELAAEGVDTLALPPGGRLRDLARLPAVVGSIAEAARSVDAHVLQATGEKMSVYTGWAARRVQRPAVFWLHDSPSTSPAALAVQTAMTLTPRASVVTCARWLAAAFGARGLPARAIQNGIELDLLPDEAAGAAARAGVLADAGWPHDAVVFTHVARLQRWKGTDVFLRAASRVAARHPSARFLVVGSAMFGQDEAWAAGLPDLAERLGLAGRAHFTGYRSDSLELMAGSDAVVHASLRPDPFPTVVLEGLCLGRPVVATRTRGPEEEIDDGRTGLLVGPGDELGLAEALTSLAGDASRRRRLGETALEVGRRLYDARRMAAEFEDHWADLAAPAEATA